MLINYNSEFWEEARHHIEHTAKLVKCRSDARDVTHSSDWLTSFAPAVPATEWFFHPRHSSFSQPGIACFLTLGVPQPVVNNCRAHSTTVMRHSPPTPSSALHECGVEKKIQKKRNPTVASYQKDTRFNSRDPFSACDDVLCVFNVVVVRTVWFFSPQCVPPSVSRACSIVSGFVSVRSITATRRRAGG